MFVNLHGGKKNAVLGGLQRLEMRSKPLVVKLHKSGEATQLSRIEQEVPHWNTMEIYGGQLLCFLSVLVLHLQ